MWFKAVLPSKSLFLIIYYQSLNNQAYVNGSAQSIEAGALLGDVVTIFSGASKNGEISLTNLVNLDKIPQGLYLKKNFSSVTIQGIVPSDVNSFSVELIDTSGNIGLHISLRFPEETTVFNKYIKKEKKKRLFYNEEKTGGWAYEEKYKELAIKPGNEFEIIISTSEWSFKIEINGQLYWYETRAPVENLKFLKIEGDVMTTSINWNGLNKQSFDAAETKIDIPLLANIVNFDKIPQRMNLKRNGASVTIKGVVPSDVNRFSVELIDDTSSNIGLHISLRFPEETTIFNSYEKERLYRNKITSTSKRIGGWAQEEIYQQLAITPGTFFEIIISTTDEEFFIIQINWMTYRFKFRTPLENLKKLRIEGDVLTTSVQWNGLSD